MDKPGSVRMLRIVAAAVLILSSVLVNLHPDSVNDIVSSTVSDSQDQSSYEMVGLSDEEKWPVIRISFPGKPFPNSLLGEIFEGDNSAQKYISEMSGNESKLTHTILDGVWESQYDDTYWGADSDLERDSGIESGGARELAMLAITELFQDQDISKWDLNGDYVVDRILILHSGQPQEEGGSSSTIWSHFSPFHEPVLIGDYRFEHYTMASVHGGLGVTVHEMLHQMGAVDLYDVHSDSPTKSWHGLGDWGIMASGNWIGDGDLPSLPSSTTLELIGATIPIVPNAHVDHNFTIAPISSGGTPLKFEIADGEYVWITQRSNIGFDKGLPGHGILVEQQDLAFGDMDSNLVNTDPTKPWVKIVEADGNDALLRGSDYGSSGDTFTVGDRFGHTGLQIWDNRGRLVPWTITVTSVTDQSATIEYDFIGDQKTNISTPRNPIVLLPNETAQVVVSTDLDCDLYYDLSISAQILESSESTYIIHLENFSDSSAGKGTISGTIGCLGRNMTRLSLDWAIVNHRFTGETLEADIAWDRTSTVELYPESEGDGPRIYTISVDGPAGRISHAATSGTYYPGQPIVLDIDPDGLLTPRMVARGDLVFVDSDNIEQRIPLILNSGGDLPFGPLNWLTIPSNAISTVLILLAISISTGKNNSNGNSEKSQTPI